MRILRTILTICLALTVMGVSAKKKDKVDKADQFTQIYAFGIALSFNDSTTFYTDIQLVDSCKVGKYNYLQRRSEYSNQLKSYMEGQLSRENYTTMIIYGLKQKNVQKQFDKLLNRYRKNNITLVEIKPEDFKFTKPADL